MGLVQFKDWLLSNRWRNKISCTRKAYLLLLQSQWRQ